MKRKRSKKKVLRKFKLQVFIFTLLFVARDRQQQLDTRVFINEYFSVFFLTLLFLRNTSMCTSVFRVEGLDICEEKDWKALQVSTSCAGLGHNLKPETSLYIQISPGHHRSHLDSLTVYYHVMTWKTSTYLKVTTREFNNVYSLLNVVYAPLDDLITTQQKAEEGEKMWNKLTEIN